MKGQLSKEALAQRQTRMAQIRKDRRKAGFTEVTVWVPEEEALGIWDYAWGLIAAVKRSFPHRAPEYSRRRNRSKK